MQVNPEDCPPDIYVTLSNPRMTDFENKGRVLVVNGTQIACLEISEEFGKKNRPNLVIWGLIKQIEITADLLTFKSGYSCYSQK